MKSVLLKKLEESAISVAPIVLIILAINLTPLIDLSVAEVISFAVSAVFLIIGISLFNLGSTLAMVPIGEHIGSGLTKLKKISILVSVCFVMGILITVAEPDLSVLASQVSGIINSNLLIITVGVGTGFFLMLSVFKMIFKVHLSNLLMFFYMLLFAVAAILIMQGSGKLLPMAFDSGGVTTGPITVPFIMALGVGIAQTLGGKDAEENSFGLIAMCSVGPILAVLVLGCTVNGEIQDVVPSYALNVEFSNIIHTVLKTSEEVIIALGMIVLFFVALQLVILKLPKSKLLQITAGIIYTFLGLVIFLSAVSIAFMPIGYKLGTQLAGNKPLIIIFSLVLGMVVVLAEPAVQVLNKQVEEITEGTVSRTSMMIALSIGVGISICLSIVRIIFDFSILYYIVPGFLISLGLSFFVPRLYTAIAFDSGGVASGPLTSSFILPFAVGACHVLQGQESILTDAFGIVSMVAMAPLITIQLLGFKSIVTRNIQHKIATNRILNADDEQIIHFM